MANLNIEDALPSPALGTDEWIVIPERNLQTALKVYDLSALEYERAGQFRLYRRSDLEPPSPSAAKGRLTNNLRV